jgi:ABC-2 type transport system permease protein
MNVFLQELRFHRKTLLIWNLSLFTSLVLMLLIYPAVMSEGEAYLQILESLPPELLEAFSINFDTFLSFNGFLGYIETYLLLALCVLAMNLGLSALGKEISGKTADFIMTKPITRRRFLTQKILSGLTLLSLTNLFLSSSTVIMSLLLEKEERNLQVLLLILFAGFILQILFFTLGILLGIVRKRIRFITSLSLSFIFIFYILGMVSQIIKNDFLSYFTPFRYFDFNQIILNSSYDLNYLLLSVILILLFTALSYLLIQRKEIHA